MGKLQSVGGAAGGELGWTDARGLGVAEWVIVNLRLA